MRGFARIAAAVPQVAVGDVERNVAATLELWRRAHADGCALVASPELGLTGYTARDLFHDRHLQDGVHAGLAALVAASAELSPMAIVGAPLRCGDALYNVAVAIQGGRALAVVPKSYLPTYREFEERRWFRAAADLEAGATTRIAGAAVPMGTDVLLAASGCPDLVVGVELCEDYWVHVPPSVYAISAGATVIVNLSASNFVIGKAELRRLLARSASDRGKCAYVYTAAGPGESSTDLAFDADAFVCENGRELASSRRFARESQLVVVDVDLELLVRERIVTTSFAECSHAHARPHRVVAFEAADRPPAPLRRAVARHPFVPSDPQTLGSRCWEIFEIQTNALATRMAALGRPKLVLGLSGGLDSTHAALVCTGALELAGQPREDLVCVTMPGLGTTAGTRGNAERLAEALGCSFREIAIDEAARTMLALVGHGAAVDTTDVEGLLAKLRADPKLGDITLENVQARRSLGEGPGLVDVRRRSHLDVRRQRGRAQDADPVGDPLGRERARRDVVHLGRGATRHAVRDPRHPDLPRAPAARRRGCDRPAHRVDARTLRAARLLPLSLRAQRRDTDADPRSGAGRLR
jgi:NAD+ synthase (glutamine-hydrolysing)